MRRNQFLKFIEGKVNDERIRKRRKSAEKVSSLLIVEKDPGKQYNL